MVLIEHLALVLFICLSLFFIYPTRHPACRTWLSLLGAIVLTLPTFIDVRLSIVSVLIAGVLAVVLNSTGSIITVFMALVASLTLMFTPHSDDLLYLQMRYTDTFYYVSHNVYYSERLEQAFIVNRAYGDTYQTLLYDDDVIRDCKAVLPASVTLRNAYIEPVQTKWVFLDYRSFGKRSDVIVHLWLSVEEGTDLSTIRFPFRTVIDYVL